VGGMDWINLAQDSEKLWAVMNAVMIFRFPQYAKNFLSN
jgi:hypothetical protein